MNTIKSFVCAAALVFVFGPAIAADNQSLDAFARANVDRFFNELKTTKGIELGSKVTLEAHFDLYQIAGAIEDYDPVSGVLSTSRAPSLSSLTVKESCKGTGSYIGQNGYGAKTRVSRRSCEQLVVQDVKAIEIGGAQLNLTPDAYRALKRNGVKAQIDLAVGMPYARQPVTLGTGFSEATISDPDEYSARVWTVSGEFKEIRIQLPGTNQFAVFWSREESEKASAEETSKIAGKQAEFYASIVRSCIRVGVFYSPQESLRTDDPVVVFSVSTLRSGEQALPPKLVASSGIPSFDRAVENGIRRCDPFPRPPSGKFEMASPNIVKYRMFD